MLIVHVHVSVRPEFVEEFEEATLENARQSVKEPGIVRFDVIRRGDDPSRFVLVEVYCTCDDATRHKETSHYQVWRERVAPMMAEARTSVRYTNLFPSDADWE